MALYGPLNSGAGAGGAGVATSNASSTVRLTGFVYAVYIAYNDSPPAATTDVTVATVGTSPAMPALTILTRSNSATDGVFFPRVQAVDNTASSISGVYEMYAIDDFVKVTIAQANNGDSADVWLYLLGDLP